MNTPSNTLKALSRRLALVALMAAAFLSAAAADSADAILRRASAAVKAAPSVEAAFVIAGADGPVRGTLTVAGSKFALLTPQMGVWFDGRTQWTLMRENGELSITEPTVSELMESNPFTIINHYANYYKARRIADRNGDFRVELTPVATSGSPISRAVIQIRKSDNLPCGVDVTFSNGSAIKVGTEKVAVGRRHPDAFFRHDKKKYPANEIVDLR